jgi:hypothetical protein
LAKAQKARTLYKDKLQAWLTDEKASMPFEKMKPSKSQIIILESKDFLFTADFRKKTLTMVFGVTDPLQNIEKLNEVSNKIFSYLNTIMPQEVKEVKVNTDFIVGTKGEANFSKRVIGDARIAKIAEITKIPWNPEAIIFEWKEGDRESLAMVGNIRAMEMILFASSFKWENSLPLDAMLLEKREFLKFEEMIKKVWKEEL